MTHEEETMDARSAISHMSAVVLRELSDLHMDKRDRDAVIESQQKQIKLLRESAEKDCTTHKRNIELMEMRVQRSIKTAEFSTFCMCISFVVTLGNVVYTVLG